MSANLMSGGVFESGISIDQLRAQAKFGYGDHATRRKVWPILVGLDTENTKYEDTEFWPQIERKTGDVLPGIYSEQIEKDVPRSLAHHDVTAALTDRERAVARKSLRRILHAMFYLNPDLHYVQGYHDIAQVCLVVCGGLAGGAGERLAFHVLQRLSRLHIRDSLRPSLDRVISQLDLVFPLMKQVDTAVHAIMARAGVQSFFTLSWILTWFSHNLYKFEDVARVFDFLLASHPVMPVYLSVALVLHFRSQMLALPDDCDLGAIHTFFQELKSKTQELDVPATLLKAKQLFDKVPPSKLFMLPKKRFRPVKDSPLAVRYARDLLSTRRPWTAEEQEQVMKGSLLLLSVTMVLVALAMQAASLVTI
jgi:hypothetical protein